MIQVTVDDNRTPQALERIGTLVAQQLPSAVYRAGARVRTQVRANASGRPGPNVITGDYRRSIAQTNTMTDGNSPVAYVHSAAPQARRLEYGFVGADVLGRVYNQPPFPHWGPAVRDIDQHLTKEINRIIRNAVGGV